MMPLIFVALLGTLTSPEAMVQEMDLTFRTGTICDEMKYNPPKGDRRFGMPYCDCLNNNNCFSRGGCLQGLCIPFGTFQFTGNCI